MSEASLEVIAEGNRWVAVNKPAGIGVEKHFDYDTVERRALRQFQRPGASKQPYVGIVHRLDRPVSGVLLLARNKSTLVSLQRLFTDRLMAKGYLALVNHPPPAKSGRLRDFLLRDRYGKKAIAARRPLPGAKEGVLDYRVLGGRDDQYLLEVKPQTGKFHQIRVQLAQCGCPIIGDGAYGSLVPLEGNQIALHAHQLRFIPPAGHKPIMVTASLPSIFPDWAVDLASERSE